MRQDVSEIFAVLLLNLIFLALIALLLWPLGQIALVLRMATGYAFLWLIAWGSVELLTLVESIVGLDADAHYNTYVALNLAVSACLVTGWSAFVALTLDGLAAGAPVWLAAILYLAGFLSSYVAFALVTSFYKGGVYKVVALPLGLLTFILFALWPAAGWAVYGRFFALFGMSR